MAEDRVPGLFAPQRRALTIGLVLTITFVASEALAVVTVMPVADPVNANARGAGLLAAVALGDLTFDEVPDRVTVSASYRPDPRPAALYARLYDEFVGLYRRNHKAHARLNGPAGSGVTR